MTVIETSKLLIECADWLEMTARNFSGAKGSDDLAKWAAAIRSIAIPEPVKEDDTRTNL